MVDKGVDMSRIRRLNSMCSSEKEAENGPGIENFQGSLEAEDNTRLVVPKELECYQGGAEMSPRIWGMLNEDLQDRVLAWLPFHAFARARAVCKRWSTMLKSSSFLEMYSRVPFRTAPSILIFDSNNWSTCWLYNPFVNRWHFFPFQFEPRDSKFPCAAAGGLLCFCGVSPHPTLFICNPMTKQWRELPPMIKHRSPYVVGMVVDESSKSYKVMVAGDYHEENAQSTEVFDSRLNCWNIMQSDIPGEDLVPTNACCMGQMFCFTGDPFGLVAFNIEQGTWSDIKAPMPASLTSPHLVGCADRLLMVGGVKEHVMPKSIRIWQLNLQALDWEEVAVMPNILCSRFLKDSYFGNFMCVGQDNIICFTSQRSKCSQALMYDVTKKIWQWLPSCPFLSAVESYRLHVGMPFCPRWDMSAEEPSNSSVSELEKLPSEHVIIDDLVHLVEKGMDILWL